MVLNNQVRQLLMGLGIGVACMVVSATLVLIILVSRRKYLGRDEKSIVSIPVLGNWPGLQRNNHGNGMDMSRTVAFNRRSFHADSRHRTSNSLSNASFDPTLRPLHGHHDPFFQRNTATRDISPRHTSSSRGGVAVVPFRASVLPSAYATFTADGRIRTDSEDNSGSNDSRSRLFPPARVSRLPRPQLSSSDMRSTSDDSRERGWERSDGFWRNQNSDNDRDSSDDYSEFSYRPLRIRADLNHAPPSPPLSHIEFPRESTTLDDVYY